MGCANPPAEVAWENNVQSGAVSPTSTLEVRLPSLLPIQPLEERVLLTAGEAPETLLDGIDGAAAAARAVLVSAHVEVDGLLLRITPRRALETSSRYTLVLTSRLELGAAGASRPLRRAVVMGFATSDGSDAAPVLSLLQPADGALAVPANLAALRVRWSQPVSSPGLVLTDADDGSIVHRFDAVSDPECDTCLTAPLPSTLEVGRRYVVHGGVGVVGVSDGPGAGQLPFGDPPGFSVGPARTNPLVVEGLEVSATDGCVVARFATAIAARASLCVGAACVSGGVERSHELALLLPDASGAPTLSVSLRAWDETTRPPADEQHDIAAGSGLPLRITEVLARPHGGQLARQFVELVNAGATPIELAGLSLSDERGPTPLPPGMLQPGQLAVIAPKGFALAAGLDPAPDPSALVLELGATHLGDNGLKVSGETVTISDLGGKTISRFSVWPSTSVGQSVVRLQPGGCDVHANVIASVGGRSSPGRLP